MNLLSLLDAGMELSHLVIELQCHTDGKACLPEAELLIIRTYCFDDDSYPAYLATKQNCRVWLLDFSKNRSVEGAKKLICATGVCMEIQLQGRNKCRAIRCVYQGSIHPIVMADIVDICRDDRVDHG